MRDLLKSLVALGEGETKDTKTGRVHKGSYGSEYETDKEGNEVKKAAPAAKKGRGRPKKDADSSGEVKKYDSSALGSVFGGGQKPKKEIGTVSKKHSLKEYMESVEDTKHAEAVMEGMFGGVDHTSVAANLGKLARVIKSVQTPEQFAVAQKYAQRMKGTIMNHQHDKMGFGSGLRANLGVMRDVDADLKAKAAELGIEYQPLEEAGEQISIKPLPGAAQITGPDGKPIGTADAQTAQMMKQAAEQGKLNIGGGDEQQMTEVSRDLAVKTLGQRRAHGMDGWGNDEAHEKADRTEKRVLKKFGQSAIDDADKITDKELYGEYSKFNEGKAKPDFKDVDKDGNKKESWKKAEKDKKKVAEGRDHEASEYLDEKVAKILAREKPGMATVKSNDAFYAAIYNELIACGLTPKAARHKVSYDEDFISDVASAYNHYQQNPSLDEGTLDDFRQHGPEIEKVFTKPGSPMAVSRKAGAVTAPATKPAPTAWSVDPINAATDRAFDFVSSLGKNNTLEGKDMKDMQVESWEKQLNNLLSEGITVSSSQGQQGSPDSVSVTATDSDADALLSVLRNAGIGGFGAEQPAPEIGYGVAQGGEEEATGTGTEPQASPDVVGDGDDMLALIKKLTGAGGAEGGEVVTIDATDDEEGQDYEDEEGSDDTALQPASGDEEQESGEESDEESDGEEEQTDEGNAFTGKLKQTPQGGEFKMGDKEYKDTSEIEEGEGTCNECGMLESECGCDHEHEQVEENFANSSQDPAQEELMKLKALLSMGNDMHKMKHSQATGNIQKVTMEGTLNDWKKLSGIN